MRKAIFLVVVLAILAPTASSANSLGITVWMPVEYEESCSSQGFNQAIFTSVFSRYGCDGEWNDIYDTPPTDPLHAFYGCVVEYGDYNPDPIGCEEWWVVPTENLTWGEIKKAYR